jgi:SlyX protein
VADGETFTRAMPNPASAEGRFIELETKIAYQEKLLSDLNEVLLARGREIDSLLKRVDALEGLAQEDTADTPGNEPPPHY